jgi:predicted N-acyltransferase
MAFDVQIAHSVREVGQEAWDQLSANRPFASYRWYRFGEQAKAYDQPVYVILSYQGEPLARATFWLSREEVMPTGWLIRSLCKCLLRRWPLLICQAPLAAMSGLILPDSPLRDEALTTLAELAQDLGRQYHASFSLFAYLEQEEIWLAAWPSAWTGTRLYGPGTRMSIDWPSFEAYLAHLNKKRRYNIRRNYRLAEEQGIRIKRHPTVEDVEKAIALHRNVNRRYHWPGEPWVRGAFEHADMVDAVWLTAEVDGRTVGSELMLGDQGVWLVTCLGLDYSISHTYFALGYEDIRCAIEHGARELYWGSETYHVKRRLGFAEESNDWVAFSTRGALLHKLVQSLVTVMEKQWAKKAQAPDEV